MHHKISQRSVQNTEPWLSARLVVPIGRRWFIEYHQQCHCSRGDESCWCRCPTCTGMRWRGSQKCVIVFNYWERDILNHWSGFQALEQLHRHWGWWWLWSGALMAEMQQPMHHYLPVWWIQHFGEREGKDLQEGKIRMRWPCRSLKGPWPWISNKMQHNWNFGLHHWSEGWRSDCLCSLLHIGDRDEVRIPKLVALPVQFLHM